MHHAHPQQERKGYKLTRAISSNKNEASGKQENSAVFAGLYIPNIKINLMQYIFMNFLTSFHRPYFAPARDYYRLTKQFIFQTLLTDCAIYDTNIFTRLHISRCKTQHAETIKRV